MSVVTHMGAMLSANTAGIPRWGLPPWTIDFHSEHQGLPEEVEFAVVGGGFTGLAATAWLRHFEPNKRVALFEASRIGAGSSGHTGGMALSETAAGDLPGLGDVLAGFSIPRSRGTIPARWGSRERCPAAQSIPAGC